MSAGHPPESIWRMTLRQFDAWSVAVLDLEAERMANWLPVIATAAQGSQDNINQLVGVIHGSRR